MTTFRKIAATIPVFLAAGFLPASAREEAFIVEDGHPCAEIVVSPTPCPMVKLAVDDLVTYVEKMSGARLPVVSIPAPDTPTHIYVGRSPHTDRLGIETGNLAHGAYRMVSGENWLALVGRDARWQPNDLLALAADKKAWVTTPRNNSRDHAFWKQWDALTGEHWGVPFSQLWKQRCRELDVWEMDERGTFNAVAAFLRRQGVRWYMPGELGEVVPRKTTIPLPNVDETVRPDFELRYPYLYGEHFIRGPECTLWQLRMGFSQAPDVVGLGYRAHGITHVIGREETKKAHPEYYALMGGKRITEARHAKYGRPCLSCPALIDAHARFIRAMFDTFDMPMMSVQPIDGFTSLCQCDLCKGKSDPDRGMRGQFSDYVWDYCNKVAAEVYKTHPNRKIAGMAYSTYMLPPTHIDKLSPNMIVVIAQHRCGFTQKPEDREFFRNLRKEWLAKLPPTGKNLYQYDYYRYAVPGKEGQFKPAFFPHAIAQDLRDLNGVSLGDFIEVYHGLRNARDANIITHLNLYVTGNCWWDAGLDLDGLLEEYYALFYGPARDEMKAFIEYSEQNWLSLKNVEKIDRVFELLAAAQRKAPGESVYAKRIALLADYLAPLHKLRRQLTLPRDLAPRATLIEREDAQITIDGKLDEPLWSHLRVNGLRELITGRGPRKVKTRFHIFWKKGSIYVGIRCADPDIANLNIATNRNDDTGIWDGDVVELLIETQVHAYYQLAVAPSGALVDLDRADGLRLAWNSNAEAAAHIGTDGWTVEIRIPVAPDTQADTEPDNGLAGRIPSNAYPWYFNVCRQRVRGDEVEYWAFSPTGEPGFHHPRKFAEMGGIIRDPKAREAQEQRRRQWLELWK